MDETPGPASIAGHLEAAVRSAVADEVDAIVRRVVAAHLRTGSVAEPTPAELEGLVREAVRNLEIPAALAHSPLARGAGVRQRAESVRSLLRDAAEHAFGDSPCERGLQAVFIHGHLRPAATHEQAASELHLSRATYFRRLRSATDRVCAYLAAERSADAA